MANIVLVPGYWLGAWAWDRVAEPLRAAGHDVLAVTLPGLAADGADATGIDLATQTDALVAEITTRESSDVVLVCHSGGAFTAYEALGRIPDRIARIVYVDAGPVPEGTSLLDLTEPEERARIEAEVAERGDGRYTYPWDPAAEPAMLDGITPADLETLRTRAVAQPYAVAASAQQVGDAARLKVPAHMITCMFPAEQVEAMLAQGHPFMAEFAAAEVKSVHGLPTGHWPMFSRSEELAALLTEIAG
ncbi:alpha/beta hydrolase [Embleya sp. NBC_00888]|uniref:alpha/beta fold hydrolase n=1 Tax=Embleya sp. NBC_00888 TaxID=2975960 RepID=UPI00386BBA4D|nr:alpha/beta hydrolase [Embleya sp. NBC_00888]